MASTRFYEAPSSAVNEIPIVAGTIIFTSDTGELYYDTSDNERKKVNTMPSVTTSDTGKFLRVDSAGNWAAEEIPLADDMEV